MMQNLVNQVTQVKEPYMAHLNPFVENNREKIQKFLMDICDVPDFYPSLEIEQYLALSKKDLKISITVNEIYSMHGLLAKYKDDLSKNVRILCQSYRPASNPMIHFLKCLKILEVRLTKYLEMKIIQSHCR